LTDIDDIIENREIAQRIEIDRVIEVVKAPAFAQFILDKLRVLSTTELQSCHKPLTEYYTEKFDILPESTKKLLLHVKSIADAAAKPTEDDIESEQEDVNAMFQIRKKQIRNGLAKP
jgi:hypothetical protein